MALSEDARTVYNGQPHWDLLSYTQDSIGQGYTFMYTHVSDFFTRKYEIPSWACQSAPASSAPRPSYTVPELAAERVQGGADLWGRRRSEYRPAIPGPGLSGGARPRGAPGHRPRGAEGNSPPVSCGDG